MQHRYYGESIPFGSNQNSSTLGYFSSTQALADYAQLIIDVKKNLSAENCPVIAVGGSYGGSKLQFNMLSEIIDSIYMHACMHTYVYT